MYPLIEIQTVPIEFQMTTKNATLEYTRGTAEMEVTHSEDGGLNIKSRPIRLQLDSFEARNSVVPTAPRSIQQAAQRGKQASYSATAAFAEHGDLYLNAKMGQEPSVMHQLSQQAAEKNVKLNVGLDFIPKTGVNVEWEEGDIQIRYAMDKLNFDWKINKGEIKFTPGDIEFTVTQHPDIIIKYLGGPIYVPPSSDPNYEPVDVEV